jgi:hypothetical protein
MTSEETRELVEAFGAAYPGALKLARVLSLAVRIEPEFVRKARLTLSSLSDVDAGAESDLWFSPLIESQSSLAIIFVPEVAEFLREQLAEDQPLLQEAWTLLEEFHRDASPALRLEEEVTWLALSKENGAKEDNARKISELLDSVIAAMVKEERPGLIQWANRALPALPPLARDSESARILTLVAGAPETVAQLGFRSTSTAGTINEKLANIISQTIPKVPVGMRLFVEDVVTAPHDTNPQPNDETGATRNLIVEFSYPPNVDSTILDVPETNPLLIEVAWAGADGSKETRISLAKDEPRRIEVNSTEITVRTALGDVHTVKPDYDVDFILFHNQEDAEWARSIGNRLRTEEYDGHKLNVVAPAEPSKTNAYLSRASRMVGLVSSGQSLEHDWPNIKNTIGWRADFLNPSQWLILIDRKQAATPPELHSVTRIDLSPEADQELAYQRLLAAIRQVEFIAPENDASAPPASSESKPGNLLGSRLADVLHSDFFVFFHLIETGRDHRLSGATVITFKPSRKEFQEYVEVQIMVFGDERIDRIELLLARAFLNNPNQRAFANDLAKSMLKASLLPSDDREVHELITRIESRESTTSVSQSPGFLTYVGRGTEYRKELGDRTLRMQNTSERGQDWLRIEVADRSVDRRSEQAEAKPAASESASADPDDIYLFMSFVTADETFALPLRRLIVQLQDESVISRAGWGPLPSREIFESDLTELEEADIVLLVFSEAYVESGAFRSQPLRRAVVRNESGEARVLAILARSVPRLPPAFAELPVLPSNGKPISEWDKPVDAYAAIANSIRNAIEDLKDKRAADVRWALDVMQALSLAFHVRRLEPERLSDDDRLGKFYGLKSELDRGDFEHVRFMAEWVFRGPVTEYLQGKDPFQDRGETQLNELKSRVDKFQSDPGAGLGLSLEIAKIIARANKRDFSTLMKLIGKDVVAQLRNAEKLSVAQLRPLRGALTSDIFWTTASKYMNGFYQLFGPVPTTLSESADFPAYITKLVELLQRYVAAAVQHQSDRTLEVGYAIPYPSSSAFARHFPEITFERRSTRGDEEPQAIWSISLTNFNRAVEALTPVILRAVKIAAARTSTKSVPSPVSMTKVSEPTASVARAAPALTKKAMPNRARPAKSATARPSQKAAKKKPVSVKRISRSVASAPSRKSKLARPMKKRSK